MPNTSRHEQWSLWLESTLNSYGQLFFTKHRGATILILAASFLRLEIGIWALGAVLVTNGLARLAEIDKAIIREGLLGMNSLLVLLGISTFYQPNSTFLLIFFIACLLTLLLSVALLHWLGKQGLPFLSAPFLLALWVLMLAIRQYEALEVHEGNIYLLTEVFRLGGPGLLEWYEKAASWPVPPVIAIYFKSLAAILFQGNVATGLLVATGLVIGSRIAFSLSLLGFLTGYWFYWFVGADFTQLAYTNIGFNFILSAIALGGFFFLPGWKSYSLAVLAAPLSAVLIAASIAILGPLQLPIYSLPFILVVWLVLYATNFQQGARPHFIKPAFQQYAPEKNLYAYRNYMQRFGQATYVRLALPFFGEWFVSQGQDGAHTHLGDWGKAWDFEVRDSDGSNHREDGSLPEHYYAYNLPVVAPAAGTVVQRIDHVPDNAIGDLNIEQNWGNAIVLKHAEGLYTMLGHLKAGSFQVREGDHVEKGAVLAHLGNSGRSPVPHIHFQVQATPYVGSKTLAFPIAHYLKKKDEGLEFVSYGIPRKGDTVFNVRPTPVLEQAFHLIPGQELHFRMEGPDGNVDFHWETGVDAWNQSYLYCQGTRSTAWFVNDGAQLYFTAFTGDRRSFLYKFYLGAFRILLGYYKDLSLVDEVPLNQVKRDFSRILQDFIAPFYQWQRVRYEVRYTDVDSHMQPRRVEIHSTTTLCRKNRTTSLQDFHLVIEDGKIREWTAREGEKIWRAVGTELIFQTSKNEKA